MSLETNPKPDASVGELKSQRSAQVSRLARDEMHMAQKEFQQSAKPQGQGRGQAVSSGNRIGCRRYRGRHLLVAAPFEQG